MKSKGHIINLNLIYGVVTLSLLASGCTSYRAMQGYPRTRYDVKKDIKNLANQIAAIDLNKIDLDAAGEAVAAKQNRNNYIWKRIALIDLEYDQFLVRVCGLKNGVDAGKDVAVGAMGAAGGLIGGGTAQILSAAVAATTAGAVAVDKTYFYNSTMPVLVEAMNAERKDKLSVIAVGLNQEYKDYPMSSAMGDLERYFQAGTLIGAQHSIQKDSAKKAQTASENIANAAEISSLKKKQKEHASDPAKPKLNDDEQKQLNHFDLR